MSAPTTTTGRATGWRSASTPPPPSGISTLVWLPPIVRTPAYAAVAAQTRTLETPGSMHLDLQPRQPGKNQKLTLLMRESVLARPIGGCPVMAGQLAHLQTLIDQGLADIRVVPLSQSTVAPSAVVTELLLHGHYLYVQRLLGTHYTTGPDGAPLHAWLNRVDDHAAGTEDSYYWIGRARAAFEAGTPLLPADRP
ncbi:Scr1 family TA system antitoxin-like transcriptional regulator [Streptomyces sp. NPDC050856]|uniref:Scr1 family TA system antitoxin-like transcriptional regulator n=1 Tax=Streptomyces sp. NPDC050856 TaxID=3154939 RepID=UPI0033D7F3E0